MSVRQGGEQSTTSMSSTDDKIAPITAEVSQRGIMPDVDGVRGQLHQPQNTVLRLYLAHSIQNEITVLNPSVPSLI